MIFCLIFCLFVVHANRNFKSFPVKEAQVYCNKGSEVLISLQSRTPIPDGLLGGTLSWPLIIVDSSKELLGDRSTHNYTASSKVETITVDIRGLYHEMASDLRIKLLHADKSVLLTGGSGSEGTRKIERTFGKPAPRSQLDLNNVAHQRMAHEKSFDNGYLEGEGYNYQFQDVTGENLAHRDRPGIVASQSSTMNGDNTAAWRVLDGNIVSSGAATHTEQYPWIQVDLGQNVVIGTVVLWTPDPENQQQEVQVVSTKGLVTLGGSFTLRIYNNGISEDTDPIAHNAMPTTALEDPDSNEPGQGVGESLQSKIQSLGNIGLVDVARSEVDSTGGYEWYVTFLTEYTNLEEMVVASNNLTAGPLRVEEDQIATVTIDTIVNGTKNTFYNQDMRFGTIFLSDVDFGDSNHTTARNISKLEKTFDIFAKQRQINVPLPQATTARYIRISLRQESYLSISEILVYEQRMYTMNEFEGGSPLPAGEYAPETSLVNTFANTPITGEWYLELQDLESQFVANEENSLVKMQKHGSGVLSDWSITLTGVNGLGEPFNVTTTHYVELHAIIVSLPVYGKLYIAEAYQQGVLIEAKLGEQIYLTNCYIDCTHKYNVGNRWSTSKLGSMAEPNRLLYERQVIYKPLSDHFVGKDSFTYRLVSASQLSEKVGTINIDVKNCRRNDCGNDIFASTLSYKNELRTDWKP